MKLKIVSDLFNPVIVNMDSIPYVDWFYHFILNCVNKNSM